MFFSRFGFKQIHLKRFIISKNLEKVIIKGNEFGELSSNLDEVVCISLHANTLRKGLNHFSPTMVK